MNTKEINQMELTLPANAARLGLGRHGRRNRRRQRAQWWFGQMRRVVDAALEWRPAPEARPEQVYLTLTAKRS
jgi:hypothetical protein